MLVLLHQDSGAMSQPKEGLSPPPLQPTHRSAHVCLPLLLNLPPHCNFNSSCCLYSSELNQPTAPISTFCCFCCCSCSCSRLFLRRFREWDGPGRENPTDPESAPNFDALFVSVWSAGECWVCKICKDSIMVSSSGQR